VQCIFCKKITPSGISRFKQHIAGGYGDAIKCGSCPEIIAREMDAYIKKHTRSVVVPEVQQDSEEGEGDEVTKVEPEKVPSSGTKTNQKQAQEKKKIAQASIAAYMTAAGSSKPANQKNTKSVVAMLSEDTRSLEFVPF